MRDKDFMMNRYFGALTAILMASIPCPAEARVATLTGEIQPSPAPLCSRAATSPPWSTEPLEQEWPALRPAAKVQADDCPSVDVATLEGDALIGYLRTNSEDCLKHTLYISDNPSIKDDVPTIFSDRNMQSVFAEIEESAAAYDGTNSAGMLQLWFFVEVGYSYHKFFPGETGVGPFDEATDRAYLAASDAFAASDQFHAPTDEAARILYYYFELAFAAGLRRNHLAPIKQVLSGLTPERASLGGKSWAFSTVLRRVHGAFQNQDQGLILHQNFMDALAQDPEFVEVVLQVTRYDFFFLIDEDYPFTRLRLLETAVHILIRLTQLDSLREAAIDALTAVLTYHERLSAPFLIAVQALENQVDCASLNICREVLKREILDQALPNRYRFDDGAIVFETPLDLEEVQPWYYALKQVQAQFHRLVETDEVWRDDRDVFTARIYGTELDYTVFEAYLSGADTRGIHSRGFYSGGIMRSYVYYDGNFPVVYSGGPFERTLRHEYAHYLADRFGLNLGGPWFQEGLAEFLVGSIQVERISLQEADLRYIASNERRLDPAELFNSRYSGDWGGSDFYDDANLFFHFMHRQRRTQLLELFDLVRSGDRGAYSDLIAAWAKDAQLVAEFDAFMDDGLDASFFDDAYIDELEVGLSRSSRDRLFYTYIPSPASLTSDNAAEIERELHRIDGTLDLDCRIVATKPDPRFGCTGPLPVSSPFDGDRGAINQHLNTRVDSLIIAAVADGAITNFKAMNCYFANVAGSPPVADLYCEGPLRPADVERPADVDWVPPQQVDLVTYLFEGGRESRAGREESLLLYVRLDLPEGVASNLNMTWSASLPLRLDQAGIPWCRIVETTERGGTLECGYVRNGFIFFKMIFTPLQAGLLDFSAEFSADEGEIEPANNIQRLQGIVIAPDPAAVAAAVDFDGDGVVGFADFFLFVDAFDSTDPRFDLDASGRVDFDDFFLFADHFGQPAQAKLLVLAQELIGLPDGPQLQQNAPNPFNSQTVLSYFLLAPGPARLELFALTGQRVAVLSRGQQKAGRHRLHWDGRDDEGRPLASGIYLYRLVTDEGIRTRKLTLLR